ncbi:MAG: polysaccharide biosynthesis protein PslG [Actinomycetota bacterium]|nr:polysaccharide biosynthesis protein PslG [Actinomycetota bacterium]
MVVVVATIATVATSAQPGVGAVSRHAVRPAAPVPPFSTGFFGMAMGGDLIHASDAVFDKELNTMKMIGVHWVRATIPWSLVQLRGPNDHQWILVDRLVKTVQAEGMELVAIIDSPPNWAETSVPSVPGCTVTPPFKLQAYADFAALVAARYTSASLSALEVENSPNLTGVWPKPDPCDYTSLLKNVYSKVKAVDPAILVLNGGVGGTKNTNGNIAGSTWIDQLYKKGAGGSFDALSFHPYSYPCTPSDGCSTRTWGALPTVRSLMTANGDGAKKIWATEFGSPTSGVTGDGHVDEATQSSIMVDAMQRWVSYSWGGPFFVYEYRDFGTDVADKSDWFGIVSNNQRHKKPAFFAYQYYATGKGTPP